MHQALISQKTVNLPEDAKGLEFYCSLYISLHNPLSFSDECRWETRFLQSGTTSQAVLPQCHTRITHCHVYEHTVEPSCGSSLQFGPIQWDNLILSVLFSSEKLGGIPSCEVVEFCSMCLAERNKAVPLQAWSGPESSRKLRFPDFMTTAQQGGKVVSLTHRPHLPPGNLPGTHFC